MGMKKIYIFISLYAKQYRMSIIIGSILIFLASILVIPTPFLTRFLIDHTIPNKNIKELLLITLFLCTSMFLSAMIKYYQSLLFYKVNNKIILDLKLSIVKKLYRIPLSISKKYGIGYLISRINEDTLRLKGVLADTFVSLLKDAFTFVIGFAAIFYIHWKLAIAASLVLPLYAMASLYYGKLIKKTSIEYFESESQVTQQLSESMKTIELSKLYLRYNYNLKRLVKKMKEAFTLNTKVGKISFINSSVTNILGQLAPIVILIYGGYEVIQDRLTIGDLIAFSSLLGYIFGPTSRFISVNMQVQQSVVSINRIEELLSFPYEETDKQFVLEDEINSLKLTDIFFTYNDKTRYVLNDINIEFFKAEKVGIVGSSGSGKSTLLKIISGLYKPDSGNVIVNNHNLSDKQLVSFRKHIAMVEQESIMFNDTIFNNILFGNPKATIEDVYLAAKQSYADEFIVGLKDGYNTYIGKDGLELSVGQKQRIAIARALIRKPRILLLDEISSNIDTISEKYIIDTIFSLPKDIIVIIVAHRLNMVKNCNKIIVIEKGNVSGIGRHDDLLFNNKLYKRLFMESA